MGHEKFVIEELENIMRCEQISQETFRILNEICSNFKKFVFRNTGKSPWQGAIEKVTENGNRIIEGKAGAKTIISKDGDVLYRRTCVGAGETLSDGTPTLCFRIERPSGVTNMTVKPTVDGKLRPGHDPMFAPNIQKPLSYLNI